MTVIEKPDNLADVCRAQGQALGTATAMEFEGRITSFATFDRHSNQVANGLLALGLKPGERIAYLGKNSDIYFELLFGAMKSRVVMAPVNWRLAGPEIAFIVNDCKATVLFVGPEFVEQARKLAGQLPHVQTIMTTEGGAEEWPDFAAWRDTHSDAPPPVRVERSDIAIQLYTSGTTGHPKGAMLSHANMMGLAWEGAEQPEWNTWSSGDVTLVAMPVFHIAGSGIGVVGIFRGVRAIVVREFDPNEILDIIETYGITKVFLVPAAMQFIARHPRARSTDYSRLRYIMYGASPIPEALLRECMEVFGCGFVQMYGMTETTGTIVALPPEDHVVGSPRLRSAGKALPGVELAIIDADGNPLPAGQIGEIATRSSSNMAGYWNLPDATKQTLGADNWLRTGDAGYMDADGYVYIQDRIKDMIISGGENIYPAEVESAMSNHPAIAEVAVIGVPDEKWGEAVKAMVVLRPQMSATADEVIAFTRERLAGYKAPKSVEFIPVLPRNPSGKILRRTLREPFWSGRDRRVN